MCWLWKRTLSLDCCLQGQGDMVNGKWAGADSVKDTQWGGGGLLPKLYPCTKQHVIYTVVFCNWLWWAISFINQFFVIVAEHDKLICMHTFPCKKFFNAIMTENATSVIKKMVMCDFSWRWITHVCAVVCLCVHFIVCGTKIRWCWVILFYLFNIYIAFDSFWEKGMFSLNTVTAVGHLICYKLWVSHPYDLTVVTVHM